MGHSNRNIGLSIGKFAVITALSVLSISCSPVGHPAAQRVADEASEGLGCEGFQSQLWSELYRMAEEDGQLLDPKLLKVELAAKSSELAERMKKGSTKVAESLHGEILNIYQVAWREENLSKEEMLQWLAGLELGDQTSPEKSRAQRKLKTHFDKIRQLSVEAGLECSEDKDSTPKEEEPPASEPKGSLLDHWQKTLSPAEYGARKAFSTAYQSCEAMELEPMTRSHASVKGVEVVGRHSSGRGLKREITNLRDVQQTHYYVYPLFQPDQACFTIKESPLIYDFGGKPRASYSESSPLDFFQDAGTGSKELGVDCSGFVFSALASAGLKTHPDKVLKAVQVFGINARMYKEPQRNGLKCMEPISVSSKATLLPGDIVASVGHVFIIDSVGEDPFGLERLQSAEECELGNMDEEHFDFVVMQSSPSKNGIGINRMLAKAYLPNSSTMRRGLLKYAQEACLAKFGEARRPDVSEVSVVRHKQTSECMSREVRLARQECLDACVAR